MIKWWYLVYLASCKCVQVAYAHCYLSCKSQLSDGCALCHYVSLCWYAYITFYTRQEKRVKKYLCKLYFLDVPTYIGQQAIRKGVIIYVIIKQEFVYMILIHEDIALKMDLIVPLHMGFMICETPSTTLENCKRWKDRKGLKAMVTHLQYLIVLARTH